MRTVFKKICDWTGVPRYWVLNTIDELRMVGVRLFGLLSAQRFKIRRLLKEKESLNLMFGCGETSFDTWIGIDCFFGKNVDIIVDLRRAVPFPNDTISFCFSEHFIEHLYPDELKRHLQEVHRILIPGGRYRIVVPHGGRFMEKYVKGDNEFFAEAFPWEEHPIDAVYSILNWGGRHRSILDFPTIERIALQIGFSSVVESAAGKSEFQPLRIDIMNPQRIAESLYIEIQKQP